MDTLKLRAYPRRKAGHPKVKFMYFQDAKRAIRETFTDLDILHHRRVPFVSCSLSLIILYHIAGIVFRHETDI